MYFVSKFVSWIGRLFNDNEISNILRDLYHWHETIVYENKWKLLFYAIINNKTKWSFSFMNRHTFFPFFKQIIILFCARSIHFLIIGSWWILMMFEWYFQTIFLIIMLNKLLIIFLNKYFIITMYYVSHYFDNRTFKLFLLSNENPLIEHII